MMVMMVRVMMWMMAMMAMMVMTKVNGKPRSTGSPANQEYDVGDAYGDIVSFVDMTYFRL